MRRLRRFLREIHTRSVWQVFATYIVVSWGVLEIADHMIGEWGLPKQAYPVALLLLLLGLPFVTATAWLRDEPWQRKRGVKGTAAPGTEPAAEMPREAVEEQGGASSAGESGLAGVFTWRNVLFGGLSAVTLWSALWVGWGFLPGRSTSGAPVSFASAAWPSAGRTFQAGVFVPMLRDLSPDGAYRHVAEGITDELIHALNHIEGLRVPSFTSAAALKDSSMRPPEIGKLLDIDHLLEGTLTTEGDSARVIVQLIDADTDSHEWSIGFTGSLTDIFELRERIAREVTDSIKSHLPVGAVVREVERYPESPAHEGYLEGREALGRRTPAGIRRAMAAFGEAITLDPGYGPAYAGLSSAYALSITYRTALPQQAYTAAGYSLRLATHAVELDPDLAEAYAARGYVSSISFAPTAVVLPDFARALQLEPGAPEVPGWYAHLLRREGRLDSALVAARRSVALSPLAPGRHLGLAYEALHSRDYELAVSEAREASRLEPALRLSVAIEARALFLAGRADECLELDLGPFVATRALCLLAVGREEEGNRIVASLRQSVEARTYSDPEYSVLLPTEDLAVFYAATGQPHLALEWVERTFYLSPRGVDNSTVESGLFDRVLEFPGFRDDLQRLREDAWTRVRRLADHDESIPLVPPGSGPP